MNNDTFMVEIEKLTKLFYPPPSYSDIVKLRFKHKIPTKALDNVSFSLKRGKILGILGPNGAGKTTLLKIISTLMLPDKGKVIVNGFKTGKDDERIKSLIGLVTSEERSFYWRLTGIQNLEFFASLYGLNGRQTKSRIRRLLELFKIDYANKRFGTYSTGMKRKFALIRALLHNPQILLFDEPTKSLDYNSAQELRMFIKNLAIEGKTILFATHIMEEAQNLCNLFIILHKGRIYGIGALKDLREKIGSVSANLAEIYLKLIQNA